MMLGKVTAFLKQPEPWQGQGYQWLLVSVDHCHPLIVNSVSPVALLNNRLNTGSGPLDASQGCSGGTMVLIKHERGRTEWSHHSGGGTSDGGVQIAFSLCSVFSHLPVR